MAIDTYSTNVTGLDSPAEDAFAIVPSDAAAPDFIVTRALYVGGEGDVRLRTHKGNTVTFSAVPAGTVLPIRADQVLATGTTATHLLGLY